LDKHSTVVSFQGSSGTYQLVTNEKEAYLSALNRQNLEIWRSYLPNPIGDSGEWSLNESGDQKQLLVNWAGRGQLLSFCLAADSGMKILETKSGPSGDLNSPVDIAWKRSAAKVPSRVHSPSISDKLKALNANGSAHRKILDQLKKLEQTQEEL